MTFEGMLRGMSTEQLQKKIADLKDIVAMRKVGASNLEIGQKYGYYPDNPERDILPLQKELANRGIIVEKTQQAGIFSNKNIVLLITAAALILIISNL